MNIPDQLKALQQLIKQLEATAPNGDWQQRMAEEIDLAISAAKEELHLLSPQPNSTDKPVIGNIAGP